MFCFCVSSFTKLFKIGMKSLCMTTLFRDTTSYWPNLTSIRDCVDFYIADEWMFLGWISKQENEGNCANYRENTMKIISRWPSRVYTEIFSWLTQTNRHSSDFINSFLFRKVCFLFVIFAHSPQIGRNRHCKNLWQLPRSW